MIKRCENKNCERYPKYGGRGIRVCDKWRHSYKAFLADVGRRLSARHSLHRIDNDGPYDPKNVEWQTAKFQMRHASHNVVVEMDGKRRCVSEWCEIMGISKKVIYQRIAIGWDAVRALKTPVGIPGRRIR